MTRSFCIKSVLYSQMVYDIITSTKNDISIIVLHVHMSFHLFV